MTDVTVIVATCGTDEWKAMGDEALKSVPKGIKTVRIHEPNMTVSQARNKGLEKVTTNYVCFLDADDNLDANYFTNIEPEADVTITSIAYGDANPVVLKVWDHEEWAYNAHSGPCKPVCLESGNYVHVGAVIRTEALRAAGGFKEYPVYEDYALFYAMYKNGATFAYATASIYKANARKSPGHRNRSMPIWERNAVHMRILEDLK